MTGTWRSRAACRDTDAEIFFPAAEQGPIYEAQVAIAKAVCAGCPVRPECLTEALARIPYGIAGGLTPEERRALHPRGVAVEQATVVARGLEAGADRREVRAAGRVLLAAGRPAREVASRCRVSERTVQRWLAVTDRRTAATTEGSRGGNRAPLQISHSTNPLAGTRARKGTDSR